MTMLLASGIVAFICLITNLKCRPRWLALVLAIWLEAVFVYLIRNADNYAPLWLGLPGPVLVMLAGVWLLPVLIWPVGFARFFSCWTGRR